jgi:predicted RNase H-like nuclease (RuvC/YqgF family)
MPKEEDLSKAAEKHLRELDEHLERLKRQNAALDAMAAEQGVEVEKLKRMLADTADRLPPPEKP